MTFRLDVLRHDDVAVLLLSGALDMTAALRLREELLRVVAEAPSRVVVDLEGVELFGSSGLGVLVAGTKRGQRYRKPTHIDLVCSTPKLLRVLRMTQLDRVFVVHASLDEALIGTSAAVVTEGADGDCPGFVGMSRPLPSTCNAGQLSASVAST